MSCTSDRIAELEAELVLIVAQLAAVNAKLLEATTTALDYSFDSGEGRQRTKNYKLEDLTKLLDYLTTRKRNIQRTLCGYPGISNMNLRRNSGGTAGII